MRVPHFEPQTVETLNGLSVSQMRAVANLISTLTMEIAIKECRVRPTVLSAKARYANDEDMAASWHTFVQVVNLPSLVPEHDLDESPYALIRYD